MASRIRHCDLPLTTISLVQGDAFVAGGFEAALTSDIIIAERSSKMGGSRKSCVQSVFPAHGRLQLAGQENRSAQAEKMILNREYL